MAVVSHNLQQRGAAEAGDVKFAVEQRMEAAVMLLQEVRKWKGGQGLLSGYVLYTRCCHTAGFCIFVVDVERWRMFSSTFVVVIALPEL